MADSKGTARRTKKACIHCQRKKLKCNGCQPCSTCSMRSFECVFSSLSSTITSAQNRNLERYWPHKTPEIRAKLTEFESADDSQTSQKTVVTPKPASPKVVASTEQLEHDTVKESRKLPNIRLEASTPNLEEASSVGESVRMLEDNNGHLFYIGDSASLSYLNTIRQLMETTFGQSSFTMDAQKHKIFEGSIIVPPRCSQTSLLPDREAADFLIDSFFSHTIGIVQILEREYFLFEVDSIYDNPLQADHSRLCLLNLVLAIGLQMKKGTVCHDPAQNRIMQRLGNGGYDRAEVFFLNAKHLNDPTTSFDDADFTSIQSLLLMGIFMLSIAKRNAAWQYVGMAVRLAFALGLHRKGLALGFSIMARRSRRNLWRSLYILDCFLSASLGRPNAIHEHDLIDIVKEDDFPSVDDDSFEIQAHLATFSASRLIGKILDSIYTERKITRKLALSFSSEFQGWKTSLPNSLHWESISSINGDSTTMLSQLHVNLTYFHGVILLTRPFLLQQITKQIKSSRQSKGDATTEQSCVTGDGNQPSSSSDDFPKVCIQSAAYSIDLIHSTMLRGNLPCRDSFIIYWLFTASLIILSNSFSPVHRDFDNRRVILLALNLHQYFSEADPLARRYYQIVVAFNDAVNGSASRSHSHPGNFSDSIMNTFFGFDSSQFDSSNNGNSAANTAANNAESQLNDYDLNGTNNHFPIENINPDTSSMDPSSNLDMYDLFDVGASGTGDYELDFNAFLGSVFEDNPEYQVDPFYGMIGMMM